MSLMNLLTGRPRPTTRRPRARTYRPDFQMTVEGLESRTVLSAAAPVAPVPAAVGGITAIPNQLINNLNFAITNVGLNQAGNLVATGTLTGNLLNKPFTLNNVQLPLTLTPGTAQDGVTPILDLTLGPVDLNLLGLNVHLDNCNNGPITVQISAQSGQGELLGNLLTGVAGLLDKGIPLSAANNALLSGVINGILGQLTGSGATGGMAAQSHGHGNGNHGGGNQGGGNQGGSAGCEILDLEVGKIELDLLGLHVETSKICLTVTAQRGEGNLLGNLLCGVTHLLDNPGNALGGILAKLNRVEKILDRLDLGSLTA